MAWFAAAAAWFTGGSASAAIAQGVVGSVAGSAISKGLLDEEYDEVGATERQYARARIEEKRREERLEIRSRKRRIRESAPTVASGTRAALRKRSGKLRKRQRRRKR